MKEKLLILLSKGFKYADAVDFLSEISYMGYHEGIYKEFNYSKEKYPIYSKFTQWFNSQLPDISDPDLEN